MQTYLSSCAFFFFFYFWKGLSQVAQGHVCVPPSFELDGAGGSLLCGSDCRICKWQELKPSINSCLWKWWQNLLLLLRAILNANSKGCQLMTLLLVSVKKKIMKLTWIVKFILTWWRSGTDHYGSMRKLVQRCLVAAALSRWTARRGWQHQLSFLLSLLTQTLDLQVRSQSQAPYISKMKDNKLH